MVETTAGAAGPVPLDVPALPAPPRLPGGRAVALFYAALVPVQLALGAAVAALAAPVERLPVAVAVVAVPLLAYLVALPLRAVQQRRIRARLSRGRSTRLPAAGLAGALRPCGVVALEVYAVEEALTRNVAFGTGRLGFIKLARTVLKAPEISRFIAAHEAGHIARRDTLRLSMSMFLVEGLLIGGLAGARPAGFGVAVLASVALWTGVKWRAELHSDTIAVRWVGLPTALSWYRFRLAVREAEKRTPRWYLRHSVAWLRHPPLPVRRWVWGRVARRA